MYSFKKIHTRIAHRSIGAKHRLETRAGCFPRPRSEYRLSLFPLHPDQFFRALQEASQSLAILSKATVCTAAEVPEETALRSGEGGRKGGKKEGGKAGREEVSQQWPLKAKSSFRLSF